jgi:hypothetical protein
MLKAEKEGMSTRLFLSLLGRIYISFLISPVVSEQILLGIKETSKKRATKVD